MIKPPALRPGDTIGIVAPASNVKLDLLKQGCDELERLGFRTYFRSDIVSSFRYFAGSNERRREEFLEMLRSPDIRAIFCARGGYGSGHLMAAIDDDVLQSNPKIINGASDITLLLTQIQRAGEVAFHGPMVATTIRQGTAGYDRTRLLDLLSGKPNLQFPFDGTTVLRSGYAEGRLTGGCLSLLVATIGTQWEMETDDTILVLEDIDAKPYQIDRMITQLRQAGKLKNIRGVIFGEMLNCSQHAKQGYRLEEVLLDLFTENDIPILFGFPTGHTSKPNVIVPFGVRARLELNESPRFELLEAAVTTNS